MILQLIDVDNFHAPSDLSRIKQYGGHAGLAKEDFTNFLNTLRAEIMDNDFLWGKDPAIAPAWEAVIAKTLGKL